MVLNVLLALIIVIFVVLKQILLHSMLTKQKLLNNMLHVEDAKQDMELIHLELAFNAKHVKIHVFSMELQI